MPPRDNKLTAAGVVVVVILACGALGLPGPYRALAVPICLLAAVALLANSLVYKVPFFPYDRILSAVSDAEGLEWTREAGVRLDVGGIHSSCQVYYPVAVDLDGGGFRMYYRAGGPEAIIASAHSTDGLAWSEEPGARVGFGGRHDFTRVEGCEVIRWDSVGWRMYFSAEAGGHWSIYRCQSRDGLNWGEAELCIDKATGEGTNVKAPTVVSLGRAWRMYYMRDGGREVEIYTSFSADGDHWTDEVRCEGIRVGGSVPRNPRVRQLADGSWRMYFSDRDRPGSTALGARLCSAISLDGLHWRREPGVRIGPGGEYDRHGVFCAAILSVPEGLRMYYTGYWGRHWFEPLTLMEYGNDPI